ncbi:hypothetical protein VPH35_060450 [Triticum aestivum]
MLSRLSESNIAKLRAIFQHSSPILLSRGISGCYGCKKGWLQAAALCPGSAVVDHRQVWLVMRLLPGGGL